MSQEKKNPLRRYNRNELLPDLYGVKVQMPPLPSLQALEDLNVQTRPFAPGGFILKPETVQHGVERVELHREMDARRRDLERARSMGAHPTARGTAPKPRYSQLGRAFEPLRPFPPEGSTWPRATIRPAQGLAEGELVWIATIWFDLYTPVRVNGRKVTKLSGSRSEVFWWAQRTVTEFRDIKNFCIYATLGSGQIRWAPQW